MADEANTIKVTDEAIDAGFADDAPEPTEPSTKPEPEGQPESDSPEDDKAPEEKSEDKPAEEEKADDDKVEDKEPDPAEPEGEQEPPKPDADDSDEEKERKEEARKQFLDRQEAKLAKKDDYIQKLEQDLQAKVDEIDDETKQRVAALEAREFLNDVKEARNSLVIDNQLIAKDFPELNPESKEYDKELQQDLLKEFSDEYLTTDADGEIVGVKKGLYGFVSKEMARISRAAKRGAVDGKAAEAKTRAKATPQPSSPPPKADTDLWLDAFDKAA